MRVNQLYLNAIALCASAYPLPAFVRRSFVIYDLEQHFCTEIV
jgi:hypothetical protein